MSMHSLHPQNRTMHRTDTSDSGISSPAYVRTYSSAVRVLKGLILRGSLSKKCFHWFCTADCLYFVHQVTHPVHSNIKSHLSPLCGYSIRKPFLANLFAVPNSILPEKREKSTKISFVGFVKFRRAFLMILHEFSFYLKNF